jgi:hypothetical protein
MLITVATRSEARSVFSRLNAGVLGTNPTRGINTCVNVFCVYDVLCIDNGVATDRSIVQGVLLTMHKFTRLKNARAQQRAVELLMDIYKLCSRK